MNRRYRSGGSKPGWSGTRHTIHSPLLRKIIIVSNRPHDKSEVHLTPERAVRASQTIGDQECLSERPFREYSSAGIEPAAGRPRIPDDLVWGKGLDADQRRGIYSRSSQQVVIESTHTDGYEWSPCLPTKLSRSRTG